MTYDRDAIEARLADEGLAALTDPEVKRAVAADDELRELVLALQELDGHLAALPPVDPPETLLEATLARVEVAGQTSESQAQADTAEPKPLPSVVVDLGEAGAGERLDDDTDELPPIAQSKGRGISRSGRAGAWLAAAVRRVATPRLALVASVLFAVGTLAALYTLGPLGGSDDAMVTSSAQAPRSEPESVEESIDGHTSFRQIAGGEGRASAGDDISGEEVAALNLNIEQGGYRELEEPGPEPDEARRYDRNREDERVSPRLRSRDRDRADRFEEERRSAYFDAPAEEQRRELARDTRREGLRRPRPTEPEEPLGLALDSAPEGVVVNAEDIGTEAAAAEPGPAQQGQAAPSAGLVAPGRPVSGLQQPAELPEALAAARAFLATREQTEGLTFADPTGYWANTYVPGDPVARRWRRTLELVADRPDNGLVMAATTRPVVQPFDVPGSGALALQLQVDRRGVEGEARLLLQVGLQGAQRQGSLRPAMNVGVVLDFTSQPTAAEAASVTAFLEALSEARLIGDRFSVVVAGTPGGELIPPGELRYGMVQLVTRYLFEGESRPEGFGDSRRLTLPEALERAITTTSAADDPTAPLGTSVVIVVSPGGVHLSRPPIVDLAHASAAGGVPVSVVALSAEAGSEDVDALALAGHGNRRLLLDPAAAADVVQSELTAASQVVARALRLNIRLAPGVRLVDVIGSERLDERRAQREREAERSIDVRVARSLGIQADRGEDDEGIQIIVPAFYSGDSHVVLLDLVVPGPGAVADVTVRYKDLVNLRNGEASARASLPRGAAARGPLELNVLRNLLAWHLSRSLRDAAGLVAEARYERARQRLESMRELLTGLQLEVPPLAGDAELAADVATVRGYLRALDTWPDRLRGELAQSMAYASFLKRLVPLDERAERR